ncbi:MAG: hypothetical protein LKI26_04425 [Bifidobacterium tibiigranuli]|jgi:hypothetical protein|nr:hypothetical protein [Bifidobacterium tibiigranuli]MCI1649871.1 hypothetical protein [Bifidobacterium tibiigranuli]MCI1713232.1 hypothetical protein [Bifidobacterium tibiigranuli]MCI1834511.1 hypothetical protein [Bifidobacterium tibiigranuli]MCI2184717.1 hypothetical protein [Bifidobacterium tibiigranuli]MCI2204596.1 hypothetical protein [Bifidobacterium tibiigranuli]
MTVNGIHLTDTSIIDIRNRSERSRIVGCHSFGITQRSTTLRSRCAALVTEGSIVIDFVAALRAVHACRLLCVATFPELAGLRRTSACRGHRMAANTNMCRIRDDIC